MSGDGDWRGFGHLTKREWAVADAVRTGASTRAIAEQLYLSPRTVETHLSAIYRKVGVSNRTELLVWLHDSSGAEPVARVTRTAAERQPHRVLPSQLVAVDDFVGRFAERALLTTALEVAADGQRSTLMIGGEPGVGKSALVAEVARNAQNRGVSVMAGRCEPDFRSPFQPFAQALSPYLLDRAADLEALVGPTAGSLVALIPELAGRVPPRLPTDDPATARRLLVETISATLAEAARPSPLLLVLEDLQWADQASLSLLRQLVSDHTLRSVVLLATFRNTELVHEHPLPVLLADMWSEASVRRLELDGLTTEETAELAETATGASLASHDVERLCARTGGNPFFLLQLLSHGGLTAGDRALQGGSMSGSGLPGSLREVVMVRARHVGASAVRVLEAAAVLGSEFEARLLIEVLVPRGDFAASRAVADDLERLIKARFVTESSVAGHYRFAHDLVQEVFLEQLGSIGRIRLHQAAGHAILALHSDELGTYALALTVHFAAAAALGEGHRAAQFALAAARKAAERLAPNDALTLVAQGLDVLPLGEEHDRLRLNLLIIRIDAHSIRMDSSAHREAIFAAIRVARRLGDPEALAQTVDRDTVLPAMGTLDSDLLTVKEEAIAALGSEPSVLRTRILVSASYQRTIGGQGWAAATQALQAVGDGRAVGDEDGVIAGLHAVAAATLGQPDLKAQLEVADELVALGENRVDRVPERDGRRFRGPLRLAQGDRPGFERDAEALMAFGGETRSAFVQSLVGEWRALLALLDGDLARAEGYANDVLVTSGEEPNFLLGWFVELAWIRIEQNRAAELADLARATVAEHPNLPALRALVAGLLLEAGEPREAHDLAAPLVADGFAAITGDWLRPASLGYLAPVVRAGFGPTFCLGLADRLAPYANQLLVVGAGAVVLGAADHFRGLLMAASPEHMDRKVALDVLAAGAALEEQIGGRVLVAHTRLEQAAALRDRGDIGDAAAAEELLASVGEELAELPLPRAARKFAELRAGTAHTEAGRSAPAPN